MKTNSFDKKKDKKKPATGSTASHPHKSDEPNERSTGASVLTALRLRVYYPDTTPVPAFAVGKFVSELIRLKLNKKASNYLLSHHKGSIIDVRELDFRVRNGNGYYLSTMVTGI